MALVEAVLTYRPHGVSGDSAAPVPIGRTDDPGVLRALRDRLLAQASEQAEAWRGVDPGVAAMQIAEVERLARILTFLLPEESTKPNLRLVEQGQDESVKKGSPPREPGTKPLPGGFPHDTKG